MSWDAVSAIAVVASLVFVAIQIHRNTQALRNLVALLAKEGQTTAVCGAMHGGTCQTALHSFYPLER
ncbi:MAG: hypothetical protein ACI9BW_000204 [Gammaproteobacteria bacterium]|jgi:hypothetical protein